MQLAKGTQTAPLSEKVSQESRASGDQSIASEQATEPQDRIPHSEPKLHRCGCRPHLLNVRDFAVHKRDLEVLVNVDFLRAQVHDLLRLAKGGDNLIGSLA